MSSTHTLPLLAVAAFVLPWAMDDAAAQMGSVAADRTALEALYDATDGVNWTDGTNWKSAEPLSAWYGVTVDGDGRVTELDLSDNGLNGTIPAAIGDVGNLERLNLRGNRLSGALPAGLADPANLEALLLDRNWALEGMLPAGLGALADLAEVAIQDTELCAPRDAAFQAWLETISFSGLTCPPAGQSVVDVAVFYTPAVREDAGGTDPAEALIDLMAAEANQAFLDSGARVRVALVAVEEVSYRERFLSADLRHLFFRDDGYLDGVHAVRDRVGADIVVLVTLTRGGVAFAMREVSTDFEDRALAVVGADSSPGVFAHELGHVMGLLHDRYEECDKTCDSPALPYGYGYVNQRAFEPGAPTSARWRTVMSLNGQCEEENVDCVSLLRFSNPGQTHGGDPLGVPGFAPSAEVTGPSNAVRALNRARDVVSRFRSSDVTVSFEVGNDTATEGGAAAAVTVRLSAAPQRPLSIPLVSRGAGGGTALDYDAPRSVDFAADAAAHTFGVTAVDDAADDDGETVTFGFGALPPGVRAGSPATATVTLADDDAAVTTAPRVLMVAFMSDPGAGYAAGEVIEVGVRFDKPVTVTGTPQLALTVGDTARETVYAGAAGEVLAFAYTVAAGESDAGGVSVGADSLSPSGATIEDRDGRAAVPTHDGVADDPAHRVDGVMPVLQDAEVDREVLALTYDEALDETSAPELEAFRVTVGAEERLVLRAAVSGSAVRIHVHPPVVHGDTNVAVSYTPGSRPIRDAAGNPAASLSSRAVTNASALPPYDTDVDGLIEIETLAQLAAVRHDPDGNGVPGSAGAAAYGLAFPASDGRVLCGADCIGYELSESLDFDTDGDGRVDADDGYWNGGAGWLPVGSADEPFEATFEGNGHAIRHLFIRRSGRAGLFGTTLDASLRNVGLVDVDVTGTVYVGGLVGYSLSSDITASYAAGSVSGDNRVGGLVGANAGDITASYATGSVSGTRRVGGLAGSSSGGAITASYATGPVTGRTGEVGGLVGSHYGPSGTITASYATGPVSNDSGEVGGLVGGLAGNDGNDPITDSYWDTRTSGWSGGSNGTGRTTGQLQAPTGYSGIYADWNVDLDGDGAGDSPWDFGTNAQYPVLRVDFDGRGSATWQEFGRQLREGPRLTATALSGRAALTWTAVDTSHWSPEPEVTYTATRAGGGTVTVVGEGLTGTSVTDTGLTAGGSFTYRVSATAGGGLATHSAPQSVTVVGNRPPMAVGTLPALSLETAVGAVTVEVSGAFSDPDGDALTYGASSSAVTVAVASVSGSSVTVTPLTRGFSTVTVTATDVDGSNTPGTQRFGVSVDGGGGGVGGGGGGGGGGAGNRGPEAVGTLEDRLLEVGEVLRLDLSAAFLDRDGDALTYGAGSSAPEVAAVSVAGGVVTVTASSAGEAEVTLTATDAAGSNRAAGHAFVVTVVHDADGDGLLGVHTAAQLDAVRHDLDGDGAPTAAGAARYGAAFGLASGETRTCAAAGGCAGYELGSDVDLDTNGSGGPDAGDVYWYGGAGWLPLGSAAAPFAATFEGNGRVVRHLFIDGGDGVGLFGATAPASVVRHVGVVAARVSGANAVGALVGLNGGVVTGSHATGRVSGAEAAGGLVGVNPGSVAASYATARVSGETWVGGLVGLNDGRLAAGYATGRVTGTRRVGGLVGYNRGALEAAYATGPVSGALEVGGLAGTSEPPGTVTASYWDTDTSGRAASPTGGTAGSAGQGRPSTALQAPMDYAGPYAGWSVDLDSDGTADAPWHFGTDAQYPALSLDADGDGRATWQEMGRQLRAGPALAAAPAADSAQVVLTWTAVGAGAWSPSPAVTYTIYRAAGDTMETVASGVRGLRYRDGGVEPGGAYAYQVAAAVDGGESVRSGLTPVELPCAYTVTPLRRDVLWPAGTGEVTVATGPTCAWTAASESAFLAVTAGAAGTGPGTVAYAVAANAGNPRTGSVLVAGRRVTVFQASATQFTDHPIERGVTPVRAIHFVELRARIDALRAGAGLSAFAWTDPAPIPGVTPVKVVHLSELRTALAEAYVAGERPAPAWTDAAIAGGDTGIRAAHLMELRAAVAALR